jgi:hypothetical protein
MSLSEPWLRGPLPDLDPVIGHLIRSCQHIREDIRNMNAPVPFHLKHLAGSTQRLCTYLEGASLNPEQLAAISEEAFGDETLPELLDLVDQALDRYERLLRALKPPDFASLRYVGRNRLPVTAIGLAIHIAEHGQRHAGQALTAAMYSRRFRLRSSVGTHHA